MNFAEITAGLGPLAGFPRDLAGSLAIFLVGAGLDETDYVLVASVVGKARLRREGCAYDGV